MAVINQDEIELNGQKYKIKGGVKGGWVDPFPDQITIGDPSYDNRRDLSSWVINDLRGGLGVEEMDEKIDANKFWWSNCIIKNRNHILPPRLATEITAPATVTAPAIVNADMELTTGWTGGARSAVFAHGGTYSWKLSGSGDDYQDLAWDASYQGKGFAISAWVYVDVGGGNLKIGINDGVGTTYSQVISTTGSWVRIMVGRKLDAAATRLRLLLNGSSANCYVDDVVIYGTTAGTIRFANFNGELYMASASTLAKLNSDRTGWTVVGIFPVNITALVPSLNSRLYIYLGDSNNYWYMSTAEGFTQSNSANANWGFQYDAKLFKVNTSGTVTYSTNPDAASPTWTSGGAINDIAAQIEGFVVGRDAAGVYTPYAATNSILKAYDSATPQWVDTEVVLSNHPIGGKGHTYWNGKIYLSYGLAVKEYNPETGALIDVGLTERDGLPVEFNGEITHLLGDSGLKGMFALVDASVPSGNSRSGLYLYDGFGWQCWWVPAPVLIEDCEDAWTASDPDVVTSADTTDFQVGAASAKFVVAAAMIVDSLGYESISALDLSKCSHISFRIKSTVALNADDLRIRLYDGAVYQETLSIPAISANVWTKVDIALANPSSDTAITRVYLYMQVDKGAFTVNLDQIEGRTYNGVMAAAKVSSAQSSYAVYFDHNARIYYIDIPRGIENPDKISQSYATAGILITPWFDAGNPVASKLAKLLTDYAKGVTTSETVALKYRLDHTYTDLDTGWTTLDTLNTTGEDGYNEELFASGAGLSYKAIQFRLDFVTGGSTAKADIQSLVLYYKKRTGSEKLRVWSLTVICEDDAKTTAKQKVANLKTAIESTVDVTFLYHPNDDSTESFYVTVDCPEFSEETGRDYKANYALRLVEA